MIFGIQTETYKNKKKQLILHVKKTENYYFLNARNERFATILKTCSLNAISIALVLSIFIKLPIYVYAIIALVLYSAYLLYFNRNVLPMLPKAKGKEIERDTSTENKQSNKSKILQACLFLFVGVALVICILIGEANTDSLRIMATAGAVIALAIGIKFLYDGVLKK